MTRTAYCVSFLLLCLGLCFSSAALAAAKTHTNSIGMKFVLIPAGSFPRQVTSDTKNMFDEIVPGKKKKVTISKPFYLGIYEVTQEQWAAVMGNNPAEFKGRNNPVDSVSWDDVQEFIRRLNAKEGGNSYRLPTEAEWELAARAGTESDYSFGDDADSLGQYAWYNRNSGEKTHPVGQKQPNAWGLYDMHGNVTEWGQDWNGDYPVADVTDPKGPSTGSNRVLRGGSWYSSARDSARRGSLTPDYRFNLYGFRLAFSPE